jgi:hypothetical protein
MPSIWFRLLLCFFLLHLGCFFFSHPFFHFGQKLGCGFSQIFSPAGSLKCHSCNDQRNKVLSRIVFPWSSCWTTPITLSPLTFHRLKGPNGKPVLLPCHSRPALGAFLLITGAPRLMGCSFTTVGANAMIARACVKTTSSPLSTTSLAPGTAASTCACSLAARACSVSSWHFAYLLWSWFNGENLDWFTSQNLVPDLPKSF